MTISLNENNLRKFNKLIEYYLWLFFGCIFLSLLKDFFNISAPLSSVIEKLGYVAMIFILIVTVFYRKICNINEKFFIKNQYSFIIEKYIKITLILLLLLIPLILIAFYYISNQYAAVYYFFICISILISLYSVLSLISFYNLATNFLNKKSWSRFGFTIILFIILYFYMDILLKVLFKNI